MAEANFDELSENEKDAFGLAKAAVALDQAREKGLSSSEMTNALNHNLELWVAIRTFVSKDGNNVPDEVRDNLLKLGQYVAELTFKSADGINDQEVSSLININFQISEGLLESAKA